MRQQIRLAAKGNGPAQRALIAAVQAIEKEFAAQAVAQAREQAIERPVSHLDLARRIAFLLELGKRETGTEDA